MNVKLSPTMQKTLAEIRRHGGEAHPDGNSYWRSKPMPYGTRLQYRRDGSPSHIDCPVETSSIKGLITRGFLELIDAADCAVNPAYRVTVADSGRRS